MVSKLTFRRLVALQVIVIAVMLFFGLRPKGLSIHNQVQWLENQNGLRFGSYGLVYANVAACLPALAAGDGFSIELAVRSAKDSGGNFKSLLMLHNGSDKDQLIIGQWKSALVVMNGDDYDNSQRRKRLISKDALKAGESRWISVVSKGGTVELYLDGKLAAEHKHLPLRVPQGNDRIYLVLGNSVYGKNGWDGDVLGLVVYAETLDAQAISRHHQQWTRDHRFVLDTKIEALLQYSFNRSANRQVTDASQSNLPLWIPKRATALKRTFLNPPWHDFRFNQSFIVDIMLNFIGFIPMGMIGGLLMSHHRRYGAKSNVLAAAGWCLLLSLFIESIQTWMPSRNSSILDLILNTAGGAAGAGLWFIMVLSERRMEKGDDANP